MKAEELRIGNIVTIDNPLAWPSLKDMPVVVFRVENKKDRMFPESTGSVGCSDLKKEYNQFDEFLKPIPLTVEWLDNLGFKYFVQRSRFEKRFSKRQVFGIVKNKDYYAADRYIHISKIEYVHQLQNLYFALTGEELKIKTS